MNVKNFSEKMKSIADKVEFFAEIAESVIKENVLDKDQRDEHIKSFIGVFEGFLQDKVFTKSKVALKVKRLENFNGELPSYESELASGMDVRAQLSESLELKPGERGLIPTGLSFEIPENYEIQARPRSGLAIRQGISLVNSPGTIDADYRGEVKIILINHGQESFLIKDQDRIAQLVLCPVVQAEILDVSTLSVTERAEGGFGSTGV